MDKDSILDEIFNNDPLGLLNVKPKKSTARTADDRLLASFQEINVFVENNNKEPEPNSSNISEYQLYSRLKSLRNDLEKVEQLKSHDIHNLLPEIEISQVNETTNQYSKPKEINSIDDLLGDDSLDILGGDDAGLFDFKHTPKETTMPDYVAKRKPCKDFKQFEGLLKKCHNDLKESKRKLKRFKNEQQIDQGYFFVLNGVLLYVANIEEKKADKSGKMNARLRCIFENGTESDMLLRSLSAELYKNGRRITENEDNINETIQKGFLSITDEDKEVGYIYVLKSKSKDERVLSIQFLYKIGYSTSDVVERVKNADKEPTYLMAPVHVEGVWKCYNMNPQKLEQLLHNFFGNSCLEIDVFDEKGKRHTPREWFIAPFEVIEQAIELIISSKIVDYKFDNESLSIIGK